jgi:hypothetical protein
MKRFVLDNLWRSLHNHPHCTEDLVKVVRANIKVSVWCGADEFIYTRNKLQDTLTLLDMTARLKAKECS